MNLKRKCQVVMFPTGKKASDRPFSVGITLCNDNRLRIGNPIGNSESKQELYFLSDEKIKEIEQFYWFYNPETNIVFKSTIQHCGMKLIIATTDKSLDLPQPSQSFIDVYIREYNKGNKIEWVMVDFEEYEVDQVDTGGGDFVSIEDIKLKVDKNNQITITKVKDNCDKEEIIHDIELAMIKGLTLAQYRDKIIKENI